MTRAEEDLLVIIALRVRGVKDLDENEPALSPLLAAGMLDWSHRTTLTQRGRDTAIAIVQERLSEC